MGFGLIACKEEASANAKESTVIQTSLLSQYPQGIYTSIRRMMLLNNVGIEEIEKIDFSYPGDERYGDNPKYEVFNPAGGGAVVLNKKYYKDLSDNPYYIFTLGNRISDSGTEKPDLVAVMPDVKEIACKGIESHFQGVNNMMDVVIPKTERLNLTPHPQEIPEDEVVTLPSKYGCVETPDGFFYYHLLVER